MPKEDVVRLTNQPVVCAEWWISDGKQVCRGREFEFRIQTKKCNPHFLGKSQYCTPVGHSIYIPTVNPHIKGNIRGLCVVTLEYRGPKTCFGWDPRHLSVLGSDSKTYLKSRCWAELSVIDWLKPEPLDVIMCD